MSALDSIGIARPCGADWNDMQGDDRVRFCRLCQLSVYNLSGMKREEAEALVCSREGRLCVRFFRRPDGTLLTQDCPVGLAAVKRRVAAPCAAIAGAFCLAASSLLGARALSGLRSPPAIVVPERPRVVMGEMVMGKVACPPDSR
jgi:hypothetical protein